MKVSLSCKGVICGGVSNEKERCTVAKRRGEPSLRTREGRGKREQV